MEGATYNLLACCLYAFISVAITFFNKAVLAAYNFTWPNVMTLLQMLISLGCLEGLRGVGVIHFPPGTWRGHKLVAPLSLAFVGMVVTGLASLQFLNIPMFNTLRRASTVLTMLGEWTLLGRSSSVRVQASVWLMLASALLSGVSDMDFSLIGYGLVLLNCLFTAAYLLLIQKLDVSHTGLNTFALMWYNNVQSLPLVLALCAFGGDFVGVRSYPRLTDTGFLVCFFLQGALAFALNYSIFLCTSVNSALATSVTGNVKNIVTTAVGYFAFGDVTYNRWNVAGLVLGTLASVGYSVIKYEESEAQKAEAARFANADPDDAGDNVALLPTTSNIPCVECGEPLLDACSIGEEEDVAAAAATAAVAAGEPVTCGVLTAAGASWSAPGGTTGTSSTRSINSTVAPLSVPLHAACVRHLQRRAAMSTLLRRAGFVAAALVVLCAFYALLRPAAVESSIVSWAPQQQSPAMAAAAAAAAPAATAAATSSAIASAAVFPRFLVLSGADHIRFPTMMNHRAYADRHGYRYRFDVAPQANRTNKFSHKLNAIADAVLDTDWLFWLDDDAVFTQMDRRFDALVPELAAGARDPELCAVFCNSPVNPQGGWTWLSSGNFFLRNSPAGRRLITAAKATPLSTVQKWWNTRQLGMFTKGDQDQIVYQIRTNPEFTACVLMLGYERFNTRPYHFNRSQEHFLAHFTNRPNLPKQQQMTDFAQKFNLTQFLIEKAVAQQYSSYRDP